MILLLTCAFLYHHIFRSPHKGQNDDFNIQTSYIYKGYEDKIIKMINDLKAIPYEDIYTTSKDHLKLRARFYKNNSSNKVAICFHGYRGTAYRDFSGGAKNLIDLGINVILVDERAHGESKGHSITFGKKEQFDVLCWIKKAKEILGENIEIILVGISMGGASVLMSADKIDKNIKIIADCPFSTPKEIISHTIEKLKMSPKFFFPLVNLASIIYGHANLSKIDASKCVAKGTSKVLIIHGTNDTVVPYEYSKRVALENKDKVQYELFEGAEHGMSFLVDEKRYKKLVKEFLEGE